MKINFLHILLFWILFAFFITGVMLLVHPVTNRPVDVYAEFIWNSGFSIAWIIGTAASLRLAGMFPVRSARSAKNGAILFAAGLVLSVLLCIFHGIFCWLLQLQSTPFGPNVILNSLFYNIDKMLIVYVGLVIMQHAMEYYGKVQEQELTASRLETQLSQAQMLALKMQLQPHFLFNTLNAIVTLVRKDQDMAEEMIVRLSDFLRITLDASGKQLVPLREELNFIKAYLSIEEVRFGGRLTYREEIPADFLDAEVPMLILQPLVENSVRHGFSRYGESGTLRISAEAQDGMLQLTVDDDASPAGSTNEFTEGIGLTNTRQRLNALYGSRAELSIVQRQPKGTAVVISIPQKKDE